MCRRQRTAGVTLIEVVIFIVVVAIGFTSLFMLQANTARATVDPLIRKQALSLATSFLEEIELRAFTYCDPDDRDVYTAQAASVGSGNCATTVEVPGLEAGESYATRTTLDNVNDYSGIPAMTGAGIVDITGTAISPTDLNGYSVAITVANIAAGELTDVADPNDALKITVTVTAPAGVRVQLQGYRLRYAPNSP